MTYRGLHFWQERRLWLLFLFLNLYFLTGCGSPFGIYHRVEKGQTLYRIATVYDVELTRLTRLNRIDDPATLQPGDMLFIPGVSRPRYVPISETLPTRSATTAANTTKEKSTPQTTSAVTTPKTSPKKEESTRLADHEEKPPVAEKVTPPPTATKEKKEQPDKTKDSTSEQVKNEKPKKQKKATTSEPTTKKTQAVKPPEIKQEKKPEQRRIDQPKTTKKPTTANTSVASKGKQPGFEWPSNGEVSSRFGTRNGQPHEGIDIRGPEGTDIFAAADGRVIYSDNKLSGYGNLVIIRHTGCFATVYAHNQKNFVKQGDFVAQGDRIATIGQTGRASGPHLHFEVRCGKVAKDPLKYLPTKTAQGK